MDNGYYILITSDKQSTKKLDNLMKILIVKINDYMFDNKDANIKIFICTDNIDKQLKKQLLLKETNYPQNYVFLDIDDDINNIYIYREYTFNWI